MRQIYFIFIISIIVIANLRCIEENIAVNSTEELDNSALLLREFEERGDFINSDEFPALISADSVFTELDNFTVIDVRNLSDFLQGHITNSVNVTKENLYDYVAGLENNKNKILLVSNTGQAAAYYLTLLRYAGFKNVYSLKFGIAVWNDNFAHLWKNNFNNFINDSSSPFNPQYDFNHIAQYYKASSNRLPELQLSKENLTVTEIAEERIRAAINLGFDEKSSGEIITENTVGIEYITWKNYKNTNEFFIICFANTALYFRPNTSRGCLLQCSGHPWGTYLYNAFPPYGDLRSTADLQSLPNNKPIIIYSFTGERSAMAVAYLKMLGYDARSVVFGGHYMFRSRFITTNFYSSELLASFGIQESSFKNYPYSN